MSDHPSYLSQLSLGKLVKALRASNHSVVPFVGAGLPAAYGIPDWTSFLLKVAKDLAALTKSRPLLRQGKFEEVAQLLKDKPSAKFAFAPLLEEHLTPPEGDLLANREAALPLVPFLGSDYVITTNFDDLTRQVFSRRDLPLERTLEGPSCSLIYDLTPSPHPKRTLLKLHGSAADSKWRVLTFKEYKTHYCDGTPEVVLEQPTPGCLYQLASQRNLLFLGCSLRDDRYLQVLKALPPLPARHFAIVEEPKHKQTSTKRLNYLMSMGINPIWYPEQQFSAVREILRYALVESGRLVPDPDPVMFVATISLGDSANLLDAVNLRIDGGDQALRASSFRWLRPAAGIRKKLLINFQDEEVTLEAMPPIRAESGKPSHVGRISMALGAEYRYQPRRNPRPVFFIRLHDHNCIAIENRETQETLLVTKEGSHGQEEERPTEE